MKLKVYSLILTCFFLVFLIQSLTSLIGKTITDRADTETRNQLIEIYGPDFSPDMVNIDIEVIETVGLIREKSFDKHKWVLIANGAFHITLMLLLALVCSNLVIRIVNAHQ